MVRLRQIADRIRHQLSFIPMLYVGAAIVLLQAVLLLDRALNDQALPSWLETTVEGARAVFSAMAGGLITSITLLLSMMLVAVQLASTQFSPRTLRDWLGNRTLQHALGLVMRTTHVAYLHRALGPIRRYGCTDPEVMTTLLRTICLVRSEVQRRNLAGPVGPLDSAISDTVAAADTMKWTAGEVAQFESVVGAVPIVR